MLLYSWNVNGLRAISQKTYWNEWLHSNNADVIALQETKADISQLSDEHINLSGYTSYFCSSVVKKGYSGVAIYSKIPALKVQYELPNSIYQGEGRLIHLEYEKFHFLNIYFPNGGDESKRVPYKLGFYDAFLEYTASLLSKPVIFCGDVNTAHTEIDLARPKANERNTGFLPEEREYIDKFIQSGYVDAFRYLNPNMKDAYTWWSYRMGARQKNIGWRIDYFFTSKNLEKNILEANIYPNQLGSDHCPISLKINI